MQIACESRPDRYSERNCAQSSGKLTQPRFIAIFSLSCAFFTLTRSLVVSRLSSGVTTDFGSSSFPYLNPWSHILCSLRTISLLVIAIRLTIDLFVAHNRLSSTVGTSRQLAFNSCLLALLRPDNIALSVQRIETLLSAFVILTILLLIIFISLVFRVHGCLAWTCSFRCPAGYINPEFLLTISSSLGFGSTNHLTHSPSSYFSLPSSDRSHRHPFSLHPSSHRSCLPKTVAPAVDPSLNSSTKCPTSPRRDLHLRHLLNFRRLRLVSPLKRMVTRTARRLLMAVRPHLCLAQDPITHCWVLVSVKTRSVTRPRRFLKRTNKNVKSRGSSCRKDSFLVSSSLAK